MPYMPRTIDTQLKHLLSIAGGIEITGPRGCGKTETALQVSKSVVRLDLEGAQATTALHAPSSSSKERPRNCWMNGKSYPTFGMRCATKSTSGISAHNSSSRAQRCLKMIPTATPEQVESWDFACARCRSMKQVTPQEQFHSQLFCEEKTSTQRWGMPNSLTSLTAW